MAATVSSSLSSKEFDMSSAGAEGGDSVRPPYASLAMHSEWNHVAKTKAYFFLWSQIHDEDSKVVELNKLMLHNKEMVYSRLESDNKIGAILSMKQFLKFRAQLDHTMWIVNQINDLIEQVERSPTGEHAEPFDFVEKYEEILRTPPSSTSTTTTTSSAPAAIDLEDKEKLLQEAIHLKQNNDLNKQNGLILMKLFKGRSGSNDGSEDPNHREAS